MARGSDKAKGRTTSRIEVWAGTRIGDQWNQMVWEVANGSVMRIASSLVLEMRL